MSTTTRGWLPPFLALALVWGCSFALIRNGLLALTPVQVAFGRVLLGAVALLVVLAATRTGLPRDRQTWRHLAVLAVLLNAAPFLLFSYGQQYVSTVLASIINAVTPLATLVVLLVAYREERVTPQRAAGLVVGFAGTLVVLGVWRGFSGEGRGVLACLLAICCYGLALPYSRRHLTGRSEGPVALVAGQLVLATALLLPVLLVTGVRPTGDVTATVVGSVAALGVLGSGLAYVLNLRVLALAGASTSSSVTYVIPLVAIAVGVGLLDEHVTWNQPVGAVVVLAGIALAQRTPRPVEVVA